MGRKKRKWLKKQLRKQAEQYTNKLVSWQIKDGESVLVASL
jgi:hypothetical protein